jgi:hypothetical protein
MCCAGSADISTLILHMRNKVSTGYAKCLPMALSGRAGTRTQLHRWVGELRHAADSQRDQAVPVCVALVWSVIMSLLRLLENGALIALCGAG